MGLQAAISFLYSLPNLFLYHHRYILMTYELTSRENKFFFTPFFNAYLSISHVSLKHFVVFILFLSGMLGVKYLEIWFIIDLRSCAAYQKLELSDLVWK